MLTVSRLSMCKISEIFRQRYKLKRSYRDIAQSLNISISTINDYLARAKRAGISWPFPPDISEQELYDKFFCLSRRWRIKNLYLNGKISIENTQERDDTTSVAA